MAKIKMGQIVSEARGSVAGWVFSRNTYGAYARQKVSPVNPSSVAQQGVRNFLAATSQGWRALAANLRLQWNTQAEQFARTNVFGDQESLTGFNLFMKLNLNLLTIGQTPITVPPALADVTSLTSLSAAISVGGGTANLTFAPAIVAGTSFILYATAPMSAGKKFVKSEYRKIDVLTSADASPHDCAAEMITKFGTIGVVGQKVFFKLVPVDDATGQNGIGITASCIVGA